MKRTGLIALIAMLLCCLPAEAQLGNLINKGKQAVKKAKEVKEKVDDGIKKVNGDIDFYYMDACKGFYRSKNGKIVLEDRHKEGKLSGKNITYTIEKSGDITTDEGRKAGQLLDGGAVNCQGCTPYLTVTASGDVVMDGEAIGNIDNAGKVTWEGKVIGKAPGIDKQVAAYIYFGILNDKQAITARRAQIKEEQLRAEQERKQAEETRLKAAQEQEAKRKAMAANQAKNAQSSGKKANTNSNKATGTKKATTAPKVQEWRIEKGSNRGFVDANGVVYDSSHKKIGKLPNGSGDIVDASGRTIGRISMGDIYDSSGKVCTVSSGGSIAVPGSNATVAEVHAGGRIDMNQGGKTLGYCDVRPYEWAAAIIFCDIFKF